MDFINNSYELQYNSGLDSKYVKRFKRLIEQRKIDNVFNRMKRRKANDKQENQQNVRQSKDEGNKVEQEAKVSVSEATFYYLISNNNNNNNNHNNNNFLPGSFDTVIQYDLAVESSWENVPAPETPKRPNTFSLLESTSSLFNSSTPQKSITNSNNNEPFINYDSLKSIETFESIGTISTKDHTPQKQPAPAPKPENHREKISANSINDVLIQSIHKQPRLPRLINFIKNRFHNI